MAIGRHQADAVLARGPFGEAAQPRHVIAVAHTHYRHCTIADLVERDFDRPRRRHRAIVPAATQTRAKIALVDHGQISAQLDRAIARHIHILRQAQHTVGIVPHQAGFDQVVGNQRRIGGGHTDAVETGACQCVEILAAESGHQGASFPVAGATTNRALATGRSPVGSDGLLTTCSPTTIVAEPPPSRLRAW